MKLHKVLLLRKAIEEASGSLDDETAAGVPELFPGWAPNEDYTADMRVQFGGILYKVLQPHKSQENWTPNVTPSLYARVLNPDPEVIPDWEQPDSTNPYMKGDRVRYDGKVWESTIDNNVWAPGVYGWVEV